MTMRDLKRIETRRAFFQKFAGGMSTVALAQLMASERLTAGSSYYVAPYVRHGIVTYAPTVVIDCFTPIREDFLSEL